MLAQDFTGGAPSEGLSTQVGVACDNFLGTCIAAQTYTETP